MELKDLREFAEAIAYEEEVSKELEKLKKQSGDLNRIRLLVGQKEAARQIREKFEETINEMPIRIRRIVNHKYLEGESWNETARLIGRNRTGEGLRKELKRYLKNK